MLTSVMPNATLIDAMRPLYHHFQRYSYVEPNVFLSMYTKLKCTQFVRAHLTLMVLGKQIKTKAARSRSPGPSKNGFTNHILGAAKRGSIFTSKGQALVLLSTWALSREKQRPKLTTAFLAKQYARVLLHEILHVFGARHVNGSDTIMGIGDMQRASKFPPLSLTTQLELANYTSLWKTTPKLQASLIYY